uniref:Minor structural protein n=1 Tax=Siphoviridae sp. ct2kB26 TaxID=2825317 RepID=A0A8S5P9B2_9CAUD|nr:MAG TPA: Minor structural protein [Siphoviridae sp. ct2kB26]
MADKAISELVAAEQIKSTDMFVLEQDGTAKRLQGQTLLNWLTAAADGHGGISNIAKTDTDGLVDTYTITLADTTTKTFTVTNGNGLTAFEKLSTVGLVDTYRFTRSDGTYFTFAVANGAKGDTGEASHVWIKYASQQPTASSHSMGDLPDAWMGVYSGTAAEAPDNWQQYTWYQIKGEKGDTGAAATVTGTTVEYMVSDSGTIVPSGSWSTTIPTVPQGKYLWTRVTTTFNTGSPAVSYSVTRMGIDGTGSVSTVNDKSPDESGNVALTAADIATSGGVSVEAKLDTLGEEKQPLLTPGDNISITGNTIATKAFPCNPNLLDNWYFGKPVNQMGKTEYTGGGYAVDRWKIGDGVTATVANGALNISYSTPGWNLVEPIDNMLVPGVTYTLSCIYKASVNPIRLVVEWGDSQYFYNEASPISDDWALAQITGTIPANATIGFNQVVIQSLGSSAGDFSLKAVKLELGSQQTLAHKEDGVWVLNEIPRFSDQLVVCQRYLIPINNWTRVRASYYSGTALFFTVPIPSTMRTTPAILDPSGALAVQSVSGVDQAGFTFDCNMSTPGSISVRAAKNSHGLTDGQLVKRGGGNFQTAFFSSEL